MDDQRKNKIEEEMADKANLVYRCHICGAKIQLISKPVGLCTCWQCGGKNERRKLFKNS
jgi:DNA-directed RNA polymerase subunit RPC12/RpoP